MHVLEGRLAVGQLDRRDADRPYVDSAVVSTAVPLVVLAGDDFRRHPGRRAYARVQLVEVVLQHTAEPEVHQLHLPLPRQEDIVAADVSVHDVVFVQVDQSLSKKRSASK